MFRVYNIIFLLLYTLQCAHTKSLVSIHHHTVDPFTHFTACPSPSDNLFSVLCIYMCCFVYFCLFVFYIPHMNEIIWYLPSLSDLFHLA